jgi:hypothetical protein
MTAESIDQPYLQLVTKETDNAVNGTNISQVHDKTEQGQDSHVKRLLKMSGIHNTA